MRFSALVGKCDWNLSRECSFRWVYVKWMEFKTELKSRLFCACWIILGCMSFVSAVFTKGGGICE